MIRRLTSGLPGRLALLTLVLPMVLASTGPSSIVGAAPDDAAAEAEATTPVVVAAVAPGESGEIVVRGDCGPDSFLAMIESRQFIGYVPYLLAAAGVTEVTLDATSPFVVDPDVLADYLEGRGSPELFPEQVTVDLAGVNSFGCLRELSATRSACWVVDADADVVAEVVPSVCRIQPYHAWAEAGPVQLWTEPRYPESHTAGTPYNEMTVRGACFWDTTVEVDVIDAGGNRLERLGSQLLARPADLAPYDGRSWTYELAVDFDVPARFFPVEGEEAVVLDVRCAPEAGSGFGPGEHPSCVPLVLGSRSVLRYGDPADYCPAESSNAPLRRVWRVGLWAPGPTDSSGELAVGGVAECDSGDVVTGVQVDRFGDADERSRFVAGLNRPDDRTWEATTSPVGAVVDREPDLVVSCADPSVPHVDGAPLNCFDLRAIEESDGEYYQAVETPCEFADPATRPVILPERLPDTGGSTALLALTATLFVLLGYGLVRLGRFGAVSE